MKRLAELAALIDGQLIGDPDLEISGAAVLKRAVAGQIAFAITQKHYDEFLTTDATAALVGPDVEVQPGSNVIVASQPEAAFTQIVSDFRPPVTRPKVGISPLAPY